MPRNVRNFWIDLMVDGRSSRIETGPVRKDGGFRMAILMRDSGGIKRAMTVEGRERDGELVLIAGSPDGSGTDLVVRTKR